MAALMKSGVDLGFVEEIENWRLTSQYFPSKVGGKPAWLELKDLPSPDQLSCKNCKQICVFLLQVYSPLSEARADGFHRTLFIFICRNVSCHDRNSNKTFIVFRSQLSRQNQFYPAEPPDEGSENEFDLNKFDFDINLCDVCGIDAGKKKCARCHVAKYCCKEHQLIDWKGGHKKPVERKVMTKINLERLGEEGSNSTSTDILFPEYDLVTEAEPDTSSLNDDSTNELQATSDATSSEGAGNEEFDLAELEEMAIKETKDDKQFVTFQRRMKLEPDQVLRYNKGGEPLWVSRSNQPQPEDIPQCSCGAQRQFEFQIMPQLLNHLKVDQLDASIDWGTLAVYTCSESCGAGTAYQEEFIWKQDYGMSPSEVPLQPS